MLDLFQRWGGGSQTCLWLAQSHLAIQGHGWILNPDLHGAQDWGRPAPASRRAPGSPSYVGLQREHPGASIQGLARQTTEPGDVSVAMETLPLASGRTSLPGTVSLCVDFAMRCQGSGACWAGWQGVGTADKNPHRIPATSSSQQGALSPREGGAAGPAWL